MDLFGIIALTFLISVLIFSARWTYDYGFLTWLIALIIGVCTWVGFIFVGIQINTNSEKAYLQKYLVQKETIEMSLENENLSGLERIELVKQAIELNGELAEKKAYIKYWYSGVNDKTIYDNVEFINLNKGE